MSREFFWGIVIAVPMGAYFLFHVIKGVRSGTIELYLPPGLQSLFEPGTFMRIERPKAYWSTISFYGLLSIGLLILGPVLALR